RLVLQELVGDAVHAAVVAGLHVGPDALLQQGRAGDDLEDAGRGIERLGGGAFAVFGQRQDLAGLRIERHHRRAHRLVHLEQLLHLPLQLGLDGEPHVLAVVGAGHVRAAREAGLLPQGQPLRMIDVLRDRVGGGRRHLHHLGGGRRRRLRLRLLDRGSEVVGIWLLSLVGGIVDGRGLARAGLLLLRAGGEAEAGRRAGGDDQGGSDALAGIFHGGFYLDGSVRQINLPARWFLPRPDKNRRSGRRSPPTCGRGTSSPSWSWWRWPSRSAAPSTWA